MSTTNNLNDPVHDRDDGSGVRPAENPSGEHYGLDGSSDPSKTHRNIIEHARAAASKEQSMSLWQGLKLYPKAVGWSVLISTCIAMEGYDVCLVNNFCTSAYQMGSFLFNVTTNKALLTRLPLRRVSSIHPEIWRTTA